IKLGENKMVDLRIVISDPKTGKSVQREVKDDSRKSFHGLRLGDKVRGELMDLTGFEFTLTGGSDDSGFPMRRDVQGQAKKQILATKGTGIRENLKNGLKIRKTVAGNTVGPQTAQLNLKIEKAGSQDIFPKKVEKAEEKKAE
ncbi:MAG: S6e family ribosomal protein, partial [Nanoarchaeota archaeon]